MDLILDRIKHIMEKEGVSPSALADQIGISRPLMSHVMSGRNKPSLQLILKILSHFPHYSADWLLLGKEVQTTPLEVATNSEAVQPQQKSVEDSSPQPPVQNPRTAPTPVTINHSETEQVIVFYADKTYSVYKPR